MGAYKKAKETEDMRKDRIRLSKTMTTKVVPSGKTYSRKNYKVDDET